MRCSVVIPCHDGADLTRLCIDSLLQLDGGPPAEILLVDNDSRDATPELGRCSPLVRVLRQDRNLGFAGGVNAGIREARGELVLVLNNDTQAATGLLREMEAVLAGCERMGAVAPFSNHVKGHAWLAVGNRGRTAAGRDELQAELRLMPPVQDVGTLAGLCLLVRRATFDEVGLFDERFGHGNFEDDDFSLRLRLRGFRLGIAARAFLHHEGHATFKHLGLDVRAELGKRHEQFIAKWRHDPAGLACVRDLAGDAAGAAHAALAARSAWPDWPDADWYLGSWYGGLHEYERALAHLGALLRRCPHHVDAKVMVLRCQLRLEAHADFQATLRSILRDATSRLQQRDVLGLAGEQAWRTGDMEHGVQCFTEALALTPHDAALQNWIGLCHLGAGRFEPAAAHFEVAAAAGFAIAFSNLGICRAHQGRHREARVSFDKATELLPHNPIAHANSKLMATVGHGMADVGLASRGRG